MKMVLAIVNSDDAEALIEVLLNRDFRVTTMATMGGFLRRQNTTLLVGTSEEKVDEVLELVKANTHPHRTRLPERFGNGSRAIGAATIFVLDMDTLYHF